MKTLRFTKYLCCFLALSACAPAVKKQIPLQQAVLSTPTIVSEYRIQTGDMLDVKFFYCPELNESVTVRPDGRISLQLANEIKVVGMTPAELTQLLKNRYSKEIDSPEVTVIVRTFSAQRVYVDGEVSKSGLVTLSDQMTILQSISQAGGFKDSARYDGVVVIRRDAENNLTAILVDLKEAIENTDMSQNIVLLPNDIVYVPKSKISNLNVWVDQYIRKNIPIPLGIGTGL